MQRLVSCTLQDHLLSVAWSSLERCKQWHQHRSIQHDLPANNSNNKLHALSGWDRLTGPNMHESLACSFTISMRIKLLVLHSQSQSFHMLNADLPQSSVLHSKGIIKQQRLHCELALSNSKLCSLYFDQNLPRGKGNTTQNDRLQENADGYGQDSQCSILPTGYICAIMCIDLLA